MLGSVAGISATLSPAASSVGGLSAVVAGSFFWRGVGGSAPIDSLAQSQAIRVLLYYLMYTFYL